MFETEFMALGKECAELFRALGKTMRRMKKHDFHEVLQRAEEVAIFLQHKIARQTDQLLQVSHSYSSLPEDNSDDHLDDIFKEVLQARSILSDSSNDNANYLDKTGQTLHVPAMTLPELQPETRGKELEGKQNKVKKGKPLPEGRAGEILKRRGSIGQHWETTVQRLAALSLLKFASLLIEIAAKGKYAVGVVDALSEKARFEKAAPGDSKPSQEFVSVFSTL